MIALLHILKLVVQTAVLCLECMRDVSLVTNTEIRGYVHRSFVTERKTCVPENNILTR